MDIILISLNIIAFINRVLVPLIFSIAFIVFIWGMFQYFVAGGADSEKREQGRNLALAGIIGFFIMVSIWGIVNALVGTFGFGSQARPLLPAFGGGDYGGGGSFGGGSFGGNVPDGGACTTSPQCAGSSSICVTNGTTGQGTCRSTGN